MTCVAAIELPDSVVMAYDSASSGGGMIRKTRLSKVFKIGNMIFGYTYSFRVGQVIQYSFKPPTRLPGVDDLCYLSTSFIDEMRKVLKEKGIRKEKDEVESGGKFLLGYHGKLYTIDYDFQVNSDKIGFSSIGSGEKYALGSLFTTRDDPDYRGRLLLALSSASRFSTTVTAPFFVLEGGKTSG